MSEVNLLEYYNRERYLLESVRPRYHETGELTAEDLFTIVAWKAERAKSKIARRLLEKAETPDLREAAARLGREICQAQSWEGRLKVVNEEWGLRLPMASAVLSILYPDSYSVFDVRVCEELSIPEGLADWIWHRRVEAYREYVKAVDEAVDADLDLRDKDRILWARSVWNQLVRDIDGSFGIT